MTIRRPLPPEWELYKLVKLTGWDVETIERTDARLLDWFVNFERIEAEVSAAQIEEARQKVKAR